MNLTSISCEASWPDCRILEDLRSKQNLKCISGSRGFEQYSLGAYGAGVATPGSLHWLVWGHCGGDPRGTSLH